MKWDEINPSNGLSEKNVVCFIGHGIEKKRI
jgi:hypothetical protein